MVYTWPLTGFLYPFFGVFVCTRMILGPFGFKGDMDVDIDIDIDIDMAVSIDWGVL